MEWRDGKGAEVTEIRNFWTYYEVQLSPIIKTFIVKFNDWDWTLLKNEIVVHGNPSEHPDDPLRTRYSFISWNNDFRYITDNLTITAQYNKNNTELNDEADILSYSLGISPKILEAVIDKDTYTVDIEVENGTDLTNLFASFTLSQGATAKVNGLMQKSEITSNDFSRPVTYTITSCGGTTIKDYVVTVVIAANTETDILSYGFGMPPQSGETLINHKTHNIDIKVIQGTDISNLVGSFTLSEGAHAKVNGTLPQSGITSNDFTNPVRYTVIAEDGTATQDWMVTVNFGSIVGINTYFDQDHIRIYPNPFTDFTTIEFMNPGNVECRLTLYDISGAVLLEKGNITVEKIELKRGNLIPGVHILELRGKDIIRSIIIVE